MHESGNGPFSHGLGPSQLIAAPRDLERGIAEVEGQPSRQRSTLVTECRRWKFDAVAVDGLRHVISAGTRVRPWRGVLKRGRHRCHRVGDRWRPAAIWSEI
jgi:hypothetical protein